MPDMDARRLKLAERRRPRDHVRVDLSPAPPWATMSLPSLLERSGLELGKPAIVFEGQSHTYGELRAAARGVADALIGLGAEEMDRVAILSANRLEYLEIEIGISAARAIMVPLNWRLRAGELGTLLRQSAARAIFVEERFMGTILELRRAGELPDLRTVIGLDTGAADLSYEEIMSSSSAEAPERVGHLEDPHEIIFTSGTTGAPKGVVWTDGTVIWNSLQQICDFRLGPEHSTYAIIDLYYIGGRHAFTWPMLHQGGTVHIKPSSGFDARQVMRYVCEHGITHVLWVPTMLYEILRLPDLEEFDTSRLQMIMCGGQAVPLSISEQTQRTFPATEFIPVYGLTEGGAAVTFIRPAEARRKPGSVGRPALHAEIQITGPEDQRLPPGVEGEILVRAPSVSAGYWRDAAMTSRLISGGWLRTGDMGYLDDEGFLYISGRKGDMIISGAMNIFPAEIEEVLRQHPAIADVAVIGLLDEKWGESVCAVIEVVDGATIEERDVIEFCSERLASYKKPKAVKVVDALPRTVAGKPKKFLLRERFSTLGDRSSAGGRAEGAEAVDPPAAPAAD